MLFHGIYSGIVVDNADGRQLGRIKAQIPVVFGPTPNGNIAVADLPWALPAGTPLGQTDQTGGVMWVPNLGDPVMIMFLDGEPEKPVWFWGMAPPDNTAKVLEYASSGSTATPASNTNPQSTTAVTVAGAGGGSPLPGPTADGGSPLPMWKLTRFGHQMSMSSVGIVQSTKGGYGIVYTDSAPGQHNGSVTCYTPLGGFLDISDNDVAPQAGTTMTIQMQNVCINVFQEWLHYAQTFDFICSRSAVGTLGSPSSANNSSPSQQGITTQQAGALTTTSTPFGIQADRIVLGYRTAPPATSTAFFNPVTGDTTAAGTRAAAPKLDPIVRVSDMDAYTLSLTNWIDNLLTTKLTTYFQSVQQLYDTHTHPNGNMGSPTGPPLEPLTEWVAPQPTLKVNFTNGNLPTGSPIVFGTKQVS